MKYLVIFETPVAGGWAVKQVEAMAVVEADDSTFSMPYGWQPQEIGGLAVSDVKYIIPMPSGEIEVICSEWDRTVPLDMTGETATLLDADTMRPAEVE